MQGLQLDIPARFYAVGEITESTFARLQEMQDAFNAAFPNPSPADRSVFYRDIVDYLITRLDSIASFTRLPVQLPETFEDALAAQEDFDRAICN